MASLNTIFKKVFLEELQEEGFVKVKGRQPYLVRVVEGGEIIHILSCKTAFCGERGYKAFVILGFVSTIYGTSIINFAEAPSWNTDVHLNLFQFYYRTNKIDCDQKYRHELFSFVYKADDEESLYAAMRHALAETRKVMLSVFDKTVDLNSCAKFFMRYGQDHHEWLIYLKVNNRDELVEEAQKLLQEEIFEAENRDNYQNITKEQYIKELPERYGGYWKIAMAKWDETLADPNKYAEAIEKMECNKTKNIEKLRSFGLTV